MNKAMVSKEQHGRDPQPKEFNRLNLGPCRDSWGSNSFIFLQFSVFLPTSTIWNPDFSSFIEYLYFKCLYFSFGNIYEHT